jgi:hypothetical protein
VRRTLQVSCRDSSGQHFAEHLNFFGLEGSSGFITLNFEASWIMTFGDYERLRPVIAYKENRISNLSDDDRSVAE